MNVEERVEELLAPIVATLGVELLDVELTGGILRLTVDRVGDDDPDHDPDQADGADEIDRAERADQGGVTTDRLAEVNRLVGPILDQHDPIPGRYTLEVSSPGLERPLKRPGHYRRAIGETVVVKMRPGTEPRRYKGELTGIDEIAASVSVTEVDGVDLDEPRTERLALDDVDSARTVFEWGPQPKPGGGAKRQKNQKKQSGGKNKKQRGGNTKAGKSARSRGVR